jgi:hypothetical protein
VLTMNETMIDRYRRWFEYEKHSHAKTLDSLNHKEGEVRNRVPLCFGRHFEIYVDQVSFSRTGLTSFYFYCSTKL